jgi:NAD-dependent dihydropyrimidine dehydrogenase PreA subunit
LFSEKSLGLITFDRDRCNGCRDCFDLCPVGVWEDLGHDKKVDFRDRDACFACGACVRQCSKKALSLS